MTGSNYAPPTWPSVLASAVQPNVMGIQATVPVNTTKSIDTLIADDSLINGIQLLVNGSTFGDTVTVEIVDKNGVYFPANTVVATPVTNFNIITSDQLQADYHSIAPFKLLGGLYIRIIYTSTGGLLANVDVNANFILAKVLY